MNQPSSEKPITAPAPDETPHPRDLIQSINADFYNVSDGEGKPTASLVVLVDSARKPVRAELHLSGTATDDSGRQAVRQAQHILEERYRGPAELPMQVWQSFLRSDPLQVPLPPEDVKVRSALVEMIPEGVRSRGMAVLLGLGLLLGALFIWLIVAWLSNPAETPVAETTLAPASGGIEAPAEDAAASDAQPVDDLAPIEAAAAPAEPAAMPTSATADPNISVSKRVKILPTYKLSLCAQPGPCSGNEIGYMENGAEATVIGGPEQLRGISDTIVWWEVKLDDGVVGWAAANESSVGKLLEAID